MSETQPTGFHPRTSALTDDMVEYEGYWLAKSYGDPADEYTACREAAAVIDLSPLRKYEVVGPDAENLLQACVPRDVRRLANGQITYTAMCNPDGGMIDDGTLMRLHNDNFRWVGGSDASGEWLAEQGTAMGLRVYVRPAIHMLHNIAVQGPRSLEVLEQVVWTPPAQQSIAELGWFRLAIAARVHTLDGIPLVVSRTGYSGEKGYELWCTPDDAPAVWDAVFEAGESVGIKPLGLEALDTLRVEAGLIFAGYEFDESTDPFEAGIGSTVPLDTKEEDFIGRDSLIKRKADATRTLVGLQLDGDSTAAGPVVVGGSEVGQVTSPVVSPQFGSIALARIAVEHTSPATKVTVGDQSGIVTALPFYDPSKSRIRA